MREAKTPIDRQSRPGATQTTEKPNKNPGPRDYPFGTWGHRCPPATVTHLNVKTMTELDQSNLTTPATPGLFRRTLNAIGLATLVAIGVLVSPEIGVLDRFDFGAVSASTEAAFDDATTTEKPSTFESTMPAGLTNDVRDQSITPPATAVASRTSLTPGKIVWDSLLLRLERSFAWMARMWERTRLA